MTLPHVDVDALGWVLAMPMRPGAQQQQQQHTRAPGQAGHSQRAPKIKLQAPAQHLQAQRVQQQAAGALPCGGPAIRTPSIPMPGVRQAKPPAAQAPQQPQRQHANLVYGIGSAPQAMPGRSAQPAATHPHAQLHQQQQQHRPPQQHGRGNPHLLSPLGGLFPLSRPSSAAGGSRGGAAAPRWQPNGTIQPLQPGLHSLSRGAQPPKQPAPVTPAAGGRGQPAHPMHPASMPQHTPVHAVSAQLLQRQQPQPLYAQRQQQPQYTLPHMSYIPPTAEEIQQQSAHGAHMPMPKGRRTLPVANGSAAGAQLHPLPLPNLGLHPGLALGKRKAGAAGLDPSVQHVAERHGSFNELHRMMLPVMRSEVRPAAAQDHFPY